MGSTNGRGSHDDDITAVESPNAILRRCVGHLRGVAESLHKAVPRIETLEGAEREWLAFALADECIELGESVRDLESALRILGRE